MNSSPIRQLGSEVNAAARQNFRDIASKTGVGNFATQNLPRIGLRLHTGYPYQFEQAETLYPREGEPGLGRVVQASRSVGMRAIHEEIGTVPDSHAWMFLPRRNLWVDSTVAAEDDVVKPDRHLETFLTYVEPTVEAVYTRPDAAMKKLHANPQGALSPHNYIAQAAIPTILDLQATGMMLAQANPIADRATSIVSHYGVTTIEASIGLPAERRGLFYTENYAAVKVGEWDAPVPGIVRAVSQAMRRAYSQHDEKPAFYMDFQPIQDIK